MAEKNSNVVDLHGQPSETREQALERLFKRHRGALRGFLSVRLGVREELDDVVQDVYARLARMEDLLKKLPPDNQSARSFIFAVANRLVLDIERRKSVRQKYYSEQIIEAREREPDGDLSPEVIVLAREDLVLVRQAISSLKPGWRRAFILNRFGGKSYPEIAAEMDISLKTVEKYISKALLQIRSAIEEAKGAGR